MLQDLKGDAVQSSEEESEEVDIERGPVAMVAAGIHMYFAIANEKFPHSRNSASGSTKNQQRSVGCSCYLGRADLNTM